MSDARKSRRKPGRPRKRDRPVTPEVLEHIAELWLRGKSLSAIGEELGIDRSTVSYHLDQSIRPAWRERMTADLARGLATVELLQRVAWERFEASQRPKTRRQVKRELVDAGADPKIVEKVVSRTTAVGEAAWLGIIQWCLDWEAKIFGSYAPTRHQVEASGELRVAGLSPTEVDEAMMRRIEEKLAERRRYEVTALNGGTNGNGAKTPSPTKKKGNDDEREKRKTRQDKDAGTRITEAARRARRRKQLPGGPPNRERSGDDGGKRYLPPEQRQ